MLYDDYYRLVNNSEIVDNLLILHRFFYRYVLKNDKGRYYRININRNNVRDFVNDFNKKNIYDNILIVLNHAYKTNNKYYISTAASLRSTAHNISYNPNNINFNKNIEFCRNTIISYLNVEYSSIKYDELNGILKENGNSKKLMLLVGTIFKEDDDIRVYEEVDIINQLSILYPSYFIITLKGCTLNVFESMVQNYDFDVVHFAGHGGWGIIAFVDCNITPYKFNSIYNLYGKRNNLLFLNLCYSYSFVVSLTISNQYISYPNPLDPSIALNYSDNFYRLFFDGHSIYDSYTICFPIDNDYKLT